MTYYPGVIELFPVWRGKPAGELVRKGRDDRPFGHRWCTQIFQGRRTDYNFAAEITYPIIPRMTTESHLRHG